MERWAVDLAEALRGRDGNNGADSTVPMIGTINTAKPLTLRISGKIISRNLYVNPAYTLLADDSTDKIEQAFQGAPAPAALFSFLKDFHKAFVLRKGDEVQVLRSGVSFYILQKVVAT